jgi:hypothetical protein
MNDQKLFKGVNTDIKYSKMTSITVSNGKHTASPSKFSSQDRKNIK